jgi:pentalenene oxygenase
LQEALRSEADGVLGDGTPTAEAADALPLARAVLTETLRLYPPSWFIARRSLVEQELAGIGLPAGAIVVVPPLTLHRDPRFFPRPDDFDAGRWLGGGPGPDAERSFLPFGLGTRRCLGERLAWLEGVLGVAVITQRCRLETVAPLPPPLPRSVLAPADGARLRVLARHRGLM